MMSQAEPYPLLLDDQPATLEELAAAAFSGFAHFTAMQVRAHKVKALDLHLARLRNASQELFGRVQSDEELSRMLWNAIRLGPPDMSLVLTVFSSEGEFSAGSANGELRCLIRTNPPSDGPAGPLRLTVVEHERHCPRIKHVGEGAKTYYLRKAVEQGFDDALFIDREGRLSEATIWNIAFWDGESVIWPRAEVLQGTMMGMIQRQLTLRGIPQRHEELVLTNVSRFKGAAVMNSWTPGVPVTAIDSMDIPEAPLFMSELHAAFAAEPGWGQSRVP